MAHPLNSLNLEVFDLNHYFKKKSNRTVRLIKHYYFKEKDKTLQMQMFSWGSVVKDSRTLVRRWIALLLQVWVTISLEPNSRQISLYSK